jgi:hypothetical protein
LCLCGFLRPCIQGTHSPFEAARLVWTKYILVTIIKPACKIIGGQQSMKQNYIVISLSLLICIFSTGVSFPVLAQDRTSINVKPEPRKFKVSDYTFQNTNLEDVIYKLAGVEFFNVIFHVSSVQTIKRGLI